MTKTSKAPKIDEIAKKVTHVAVDDGDLLYIYCNLENTKQRPEHFRAISDAVRNVFQAEFKDTKIVVGFYDLKFTAITKKQHFSAKLTGDVS